MEPKGPFCQSCAMPMQKPADFGSNADGSRNDDYCCFCFQKGEFTWPDATLHQMTEKIVGMSVQMGVSKEQARTMAEKVLPRLKRWKKK
jgi:hypothetical protein